jgi:hypothetical protein
MTLTILNKIAALLGRDVARAFPGVPLTLSADGAIPIDQDRLVHLAKGSAAAMTIAAPGATNFAEGREITIVTDTDFAHVVTFTGGTLWDGTAGVNSTWTATAVKGCALTIVALSATLWQVKSFNLGTIAP